MKTFLAYERDGLVPNLFPEGGVEPRYNTVDAALLLIDCLWQYYGRTGDLVFIEEAYPVMERIIAAYRAGTRHGIGMDGDGLIYAGQGLDQVTWMDVCVDGVLPTPRHGKPVEINAYWYNALKIMVEFTALLGKDPADYAALAEKVKDSFRKQFWMEENGYLKDVISGTKADTQLRCNQIWAVSMSFAMLDHRQEKAVVDAVKIPVTVKTRLGWDHDHRIIVDLAEQLQDCGIEALTVHGRTRAQMYTGEADWTLIGDIKKNPRIHIPIIGNGDVTTPQRAKECFDKYGVDGIMIGRASFGRPWIFKEVKHYLETGEELPTLSFDWKMEVLRQQVIDSVNLLDERRGILHVRRHLANSPMFKGIPNFKETRIAMLRTETVKDLFSILDYIKGNYAI
mgnify:CR=1 FL=1